MVCRTLLCHQVYREDLTADEMTPPTQLLYQVITTDQDWNHTVQYHTYSITAGDPHGLYNMYTDTDLYPHQGWLFFSKLVDYETPGQIPFWSLTINTVDDGVPPRSNYFTATVT